MGGIVLNNLKLNRAKYLIPFEPECIQDSQVIKLMPSQLFLFSFYELIIGIHETKLTIHL